MKNKKVIYIVGSIVLLILIGIVACKTLILNTPLKIEKAAYLYIDSDDNIDSVYTKLKKDFHTSGITGLRMLISCSNYAENIHEGAYKSTDNQPFMVFFQFHTVSTRTHIEPFRPCL